MANKRSNNIVSAEFIKAIKAAVNESLEKNDYETCVSAATLATNKALAKAFAVDHPERLRLLIMTAVSIGQVHGLGIRVGRVGGVHRIQPKAKAKTKAAKAKKTTKPATEANTADNDTNVLAATGTDA